ncbi:MAG: universal stress protein [Desulfuromonas sp.]|nr:MAG: universal stress protein [Desulfuromonas sp.]
MLPSIKSILLATDLSDNASEAFKHAVVLSRSDQAKIHILHVIPEVEASIRTYVAAVMGEGNLDKIESSHEESARDHFHKVLDDFTRQELSDHPEDLARIGEIEIAHGRPAMKILEAANRLGVDLIVMASHGKGAIEQTFLGSVTEKVLRSSKRPVYVIPLPD